MGTEPDPRFSFANERTFLAWIRTALAIFAAGVAVDTLATDLPEVGRRLVAIGLVALGAVVSTVALARWAQNERALRTESPLPGFGLAPVMGLAVVLLGVTAGVLAAYRP